MCFQSDQQTFFLHCILALPKVLVIGTGHAQKTSPKRYLRHPGHMHKQPQLAPFSVFV